MGVPIRLESLSLRAFRSYAEAELALGGASAFLVGPNGAGKTNLLEAVSLLSPGRGLRSAALADLGRREQPGEPAGAWAISAVLSGQGAAVRVGCGASSEQDPRRQARVDQEPAPVSRIANWIRPIWLTPAQDRIFLDSASDRRRFFDRLVFASEPSHAAAVAAYERAQRERARLLAEEAPDRNWIDIVERRMARAGAAVTLGRAKALAALRQEIVRRSESHFPMAGLALTGPWQEMAAAGEEALAVEERLASSLLGARARDQASGRSLVGPHRDDLEVTDVASGRPAASISTGEQKAMVLNLVLAQAARLARANGAPAPILLLDEVAAHLDSQRRAALFEDLQKIGVQTLLTGTDEALFATLLPRFVGVRVAPGSLSAVDAPP